MQVGDWVETCKWVDHAKHPITCFNAACGYTAVPAGYIHTEEKDHVTHICPRCDYGGWEGTPESAAWRTVEQLQARLAEWNDQFENQGQVPIFGDEKFTVIGMCTETVGHGGWEEAINWIAIRSNNTGAVKTVIGSRFESLEDYCQAANEVSKQPTGLTGISLHYPLPHGLMSNTMGGYTTDPTALALELETTNDYEVITPCLWVNVYLHDRVCGGPEEGGDWYDTWEPEYEECEYAVNGVAQAEVLLAANKQQWCDEQNADRRSDISSVVSEGRYEVRLEAWPARRSPEGPHHYE